MSLTPRVEHRDDEAGVSYSAPFTLVQVSEVLEYVQPADGEFLKRVGSQIVGAAAGGGSNVDLEYLAWRR